MAVEPSTGGTRERILITGASRGIGAATARRLAAPGRELLLVARSADALEARCAEVREQGATAEFLAVDLAQSEGLAAVCRAIDPATRPVDGMVLNAAVANGVDFRETSRAAIQREVDLNYVAPATLLRQVLPAMVDRGAGRVVIVGSLTSMVPFPGNASYSASKAALSSLVRSVRMEVWRSGVHLGVVLPGYCRTQMTANTRTALPAMDPAQVADAIVRSYERRRDRVVPGFLNRIAAGLFSAFPQTSDRLLGTFARPLIPTSTS